MKAYQHFFSKRFDRFLKKRIPRKTSHQLNRHNLFILPSRFGLAFIAMITILFILGTNYQNNIILLLSYVLLSIFFSGILTCFNNLSGLTISQTQAVTGHQSQDIDVIVNIDTEHTRDDFTFSFPNQAVTRITQLLSGTNEVAVPISFTTRGQHSLPRLKIVSRYSFGIFTCWTHIAFDQSVIVYPKTKKISINYPNSSATDEGNGQKVTDGFDDFYQLKTYQQGEPLSQISWKQYARGQGLLSKQYQGTTNSSQCVVLAEMPSSNIETKLQYCCYLLIQAWHQNQLLSLDLGDRILSPDNASTSSEQSLNLNDHFQQCLTALALYRKGNDRKRREGVIKGAVKSMRDNT